VTLHRRNPRRDANEAPIVQALKRVGASVARISDVGMPDLVIWHRDRITLMEIKMPRGRATLAQERRTAEGWPVVTVRSVDEALRAIGAVK
jgi:hypothetical protein